MLMVTLIIFLVFVIIFLCLFLKKRIVSENFAIIHTNNWNSADLVVVSSHYNEDLRWLETVTEKIVLCSKVLPSPLCKIDVNRGREASSYLKFIIDNYNHLPKYIAFIHGHESSWHQKHNVIKALKCARYTDPNNGFISLNNHKYEKRFVNGKDNIGWGKVMLKEWNTLFRPFLNRDPPVMIHHDCCAQFVVSRNRILARPLEAYKTWFNALISTKNKEEDYILGVVFEYLWPLIFGENDALPYWIYTQKFSCMHNT
jgi:hypothetical protein